MAAITSPESSAQPRVYFQTPPGTEEEVPQKQGRVTVKYDRKELRRRLNLEEWIVSQLMTLYDCEVGMKRFTEQHHSDTVCILCCKDSVLSRVLSHCLLVVSNSHPDVSRFRLHYPEYCLQFDYLWHYYYFTGCVVWSYMEGRGHIQLQTKP